MSNAGLKTNLFTRTIHADDTKTSKAIINQYFLGRHENVNYYRNALFAQPNIFSVDNYQ